MECVRQYSRPPDGFGRKVTMLWQRTLLQSPCGVRGEPECHHKNPRCLRRGVVRQVDHCTVFVHSAEKIKCLCGHKRRSSGKLFQYFSAAFFQSAITRYLFWQSIPGRIYRRSCILSYSETLFRTRIFSPGYILFHEQRELFVFPPSPR